MKFTARRQALSEAFQIVSSIIAPRMMRPILASIHVVVDEAGVATLMATDLDVAIRYRVTVGDVAEAGEAIIPASRATSILRESTADDVTIDDAAGGKVTIRAGRGRFQLLSDDPSEFPEVPEFDATNAFGLNRAKLVTLIRKTHFAVAREKSRFAFNGAKLQIAGDEARMIATDGKRLAMMVETIDNSDGVEAGHIVPSRTLSVIERVLTDEDDMVRVALHDTDIMIRTTRADVSSRLVEGSFPKYESVIPTDALHQPVFGREELIKAFRQAALLTSQATRSVKMTLTRDGATLEAHALDAGEASI